jgi:hypothetical protein
MCFCYNFTIVSKQEIQGNMFHMSSLSLSFLSRGNNQAWFNYDKYKLALKKYLKNQSIKYIKALTIR